MKMMTIAKTKLVATVIAAAALGGAGTVLTVQRALAGPGERPTLVAAAVVPVAASAAPADDAAPRSPKPANSATTAPAAPKAIKPKDNMGIVGVATAPPVVVSTVPAAGSTDVDAATTTELKVTFSKPMNPGGFSWVQFGKDTFPKLAGKARFLDDGRTCVLPVKLEPGHPYVIWLNRAPYTGFGDADGNKAVPYLLVFETKE